MRTHHRVFGLGAALLLAPGVVAAQGSNPAPGWQGFYLGGGVGDFQYEEEGEVQGAQYSFDESDTAYKLFAGYRFLPFLGVELAYADLGEPGGDALGDRLDADADAWFGYVTGYLPVADAFDFFGKVGMAAWEVDTDLDTGTNQTDFSVSHDGTDFAWGLGAQVNLPANVSIRGEYERIELGDDGNRDRDASLISASVLFHF